MQLLRLLRWWQEYAGRKNDEEHEMVADSLLYDERCHLPRTTPRPAGVGQQQQGGGGGRGAQQQEASPPQQGAAQRQGGQQPQQGSASGGAQQPSAMNGPGSHAPANGGAAH